MNKKKKKKKKKLYALVSERLGLGSWTTIFESRRNNLIGMIRSAIRSVKLSELLLRGDNSNCLRSLKRIERFSLNCKRHRGKGEGEEEEGKREGAEEGREGRREKRAFLHNQMSVVSSSVVTSFQRRTTKRSSKQSSVQSAYVRRSSEIIRV